MVFEARSFQRNEKFNKTRSKSADSGVSVALNKTFRGHNLQSSNSEINGFEEEQLDFEPEFENEYHDTYQNQSRLDNSQCFIYNSNSPTRSHNYSTSDISFAHRRYMLPLPKSDAKDGRQNEYLPIYYPSSESARTIIDSSSDDSVHSDSDKNIDSEIQDSFSRDHYSYESGNENEENSSTYSMTQEEEERLLGSSGEESQEGTFTVQPNLMETCRIGNACITLPKFVLNPSPFVMESQTNDLKRTKSTAKLRPLESETKKKKWDLSFTPDYPITQLFLDDIGYTPDEKIRSNSKDDSHSSDSPFGSFRVICNKDKIFCEETQGNIQSEILSKNEENNFKLPLPPPKRPPTRPKRTVFTGKASGTNLQIKLSNKDDRCMSRTEISATSSGSCSENSQDNNTIILDKEDDDGLSIIASTIGVDNVDEVLSPSNTEETGDFNSHNTYMESQYSEDRVKKWVQTVPISESHNNFRDKPFAGTDESIAPEKSHTSPILPRGNNRINFKDIPTVFLGLCYYYYFTENCTRPRCHLQHLIQKDKFTHRLLRRDPNDLYNIYEFSKGFDKLFKESYSAFIAAFGKLKMQNELIMCIKYFLQTEKYDATEAIESVVKALEESGISFLDSIEMISFNIGFLEHPVLADILLDLITRKYNISENWEVIKRISKARGKIKPATVTTMLERATAVYPLDKELCLDIYNMIIKNNMTDLSQISEKVLVPYRTLVGFEDAIGPLKPPLTKIHSPRIRPLTIPNQPELLAAQIDNNLIRERERFEREVEGTTVHMTCVPNKTVDPKVNYSIPNPNYSIPHSFPDSLSSGSDERYFMPVPRHSPSPSISPSNHKMKDLYSYPPNSSPSVSGIDPNVALHFEPPPTEISEYVPENINTTREMPQEDEINLTPSRPKFGRSCYRNDFNFEKSLHNLLPDSFEHVNINEKDVATLNSVIKSNNGAEFCKLLQYYMNHPPTLENFITMTIVNLKSCGKDMCDTLNGLRRSIESINPDYATVKKIKAIFEVIVMNLLFVLEKKSRWKDALSLLELFCDWDSLVSSKIFSKRRVSHMGRYIFLAKIFANAKNFCVTYEILQNSNLNLLGPPDSWPYDYISTVDLECRNSVLMEFFKYAHHYYIIGVSDMYRRIYKHGGIFGFDAQAHFNPMLIAIINDQQPSLLKYFFSDINIYYTVMDKNVLRAFTILLAPQLSQENLFKLYEFCCNRQIYTKFMGGESSIIVRNNMFDVELQLILNYYFHKLTETRKIPIGNVAIQIKLMDKKPVYPKLLQTCVRSIKDINEKVKKIVKDNFSIVASDKCNDQLTVIEILHEQIMKWLQCNQRWFPTYN